MRQHPIRRRLAELDRSQRWLAEQTGASEQSICDYLAGRSAPRLDRAQTIASVLGLDLLTVLTGQASPRRR